MSTSAAFQTSFWPVEGSPAGETEIEEAEVTHHRLSETIKVYALYGDNPNMGAITKFPHDKLRPVMFIWRNREYRVQDVTYVWREIQGQAEVYHFSVSDGVNVFELSYNAKALDWTINGTYSE
jgi:hypothetical protein